MENYLNRITVTPEIRYINELILIDYPIYSIYVENEGEVDGTVMGKTLAPGKYVNFNAGDFGVYPKDTFQIDGTGTIMKVLINK